MCAFGRPSKKNSRVGPQVEKIDTLLRVIFWLSSCYTWADFKSPFVLCHTYHCDVYLSIYFPIRVPQQIIIQIWVSPIKNLFLNNLLRRIELNNMLATLPNFPVVLMA